MMQLTVRKTNIADPRTISQWSGPQQHLFDAVAEWDSNWPGVKQWNVWFNDTIFGRYRNLQHLHEMEVEEVEEETDEHMDATALSEHEELEALVQPVSTGDGSNDSTRRDEEQQPEDTGEGASVAADHIEPEHQADSGPGEGIVPPLEEGSVDTPKQDTVRQPLPLIKIGLRSSIHHHWKP
jgi:hypothetical protein